MSKNINTLPEALIISPNWLGDAIMTQPLLKHLSQNYILDILAPAHLLDLYQRMPEIRHIFKHSFAHGRLRWHDFKSSYDLIKKTKIKYQAAYILPNSFKSAILPFALRIPKRLGYATELRSVLLTQSLPKIERTAVKKMLMIDYYLNLKNLNLQNLNHSHVNHLEPHHLNIAEFNTTEFKTPILQKNLDFKPSIFLKSKLNHVNFDESLNYVIIAPGAEFGEAKRWPAEYFAELIMKLQTKRDESIILLGVKNDQKITADIMQYLIKHDAHHRCFDLAGQTTLGQALDLIAYAKYAIVHDSGLMHAAAGFATPLTAIYGSTSAEHTPPMPVQAGAAQILKLNLACQPCFQKTCPFEQSPNLDEKAKAYQCLRLLTPEYVAQAVLKHLR